jgi:eukaryotic-like serine/threonine-protein kinase
MKQLSSTSVARLRELVEHPILVGGRYQIAERIGEGGMGVVYRAHDRELGRDVAMKVLRNPVPTAEERQRLLHEAHVLALLEHPGIVPVHDVGVLEDGRVFYVMKHVRGERLDDFARTTRPRADLLRVFLQICDAVAFAHAAGVIHRDLKPQNIMLGAFGEVLVMDWGVAKSGAWQIAPRTVRGSDSDRDQNAVTGTGVAIGTPGYMAPEQLAGSVDERADIYGLGGILIFLLTREHPTISSSEDGVQDVAGLPPPLHAICQRSRAATPASRYQSVTELQTDIVAYLGALPVTAHHESFIERLWRVSTRHRTALLLIGAYLLMRVALLLLARI